MLRYLSREYPLTPTPLRHADGFQLLIATILSAQTTDEQVNAISAQLFARYPDAVALAGADVAEVEEIIRSVGLFHTKARNLLACARTLLAEFGGAIPATIEELTRLPGVGRKTANVVAGHHFGMPAVIVDTHFGRVSRRLGLTTSQSPDQVERDIRELVAVGDQTRFSGVVNRHGRRVCVARAPLCADCCLQRICPAVVIAAPGSQE